MTAGVGGGAAWHAIMQCEEGGWEHKSGASTRQVTRRTTDAPMLGWPDLVGRIWPHAMRAYCVLHSYAPRGVPSPVACLAPASRLASRRVCALRRMVHRPLAYFQIWICVQTVTYGHLGRAVVLRFARPRAYAGISRSDLRPTRYARRHINLSSLCCPSPSRDYSQVTSFIHSRTHHSRVHVLPRTPHHAHTAALAVLALPHVTDTIAARGRLWAPPSHSRYTSCVN